MKCDDAAAIRITPCVFRLCCLLFNIRTKQLRFTHIFTFPFRC